MSAGVVYGCWWVCIICDSGVCWDLNLNGGWDCVVWWCFAVGFGLWVCGLSSYIGGFCWHFYFTRCVGYCSGVSGFLGGFLWRYILVYALWEYFVVD